MRRAIPAVVFQVALGTVLGGLGLSKFAERLEPVGLVGLVLLLFAIGLETDLPMIIKHGRRAAGVALLGVMCSLALATLAAFLLGWSFNAALFAGGVMTATSIAISVRILQRSGWLRRKEGAIVMAAAVADDVAGLLILGSVIALVGGDREGVEGPGLRAGLTLFFLTVMIVTGSSLFKKITPRIRTRWSSLITALIACSLGALGAAQIGLEPFLGSYVAGAVIPQELESKLDSVKRVSAKLSPLYFVLLGMLLDVKALASSEALLGAFVLFIAGSLGKLVSGFAAGRGSARLAIGIAMIPRGEVGLVFAATGLAVGTLVQVQYAALVGAVLATSILGPILLNQFVGPVAKEEKHGEIAESLAA